MKKFTILQFTAHNGSGLRYTKNNTTGLYDSVNTPTVTHKGILDFITGGYNITEVSIPRTNGQLPLIFRVSETIRHNNVNNRIFGFKIITNKLYVTLATNVVGNDPVLITEITKMPTAPPAPAPQQAPTNNQTTIDYKKIEKVSETNLSNRKIRLSATLRKRKETPLEFVKLFFTDWNIKDSEKAKNTLYVDDESVQEVTGKRRSLGDIYQILKYYYPDITVKDVISIMYRDIFKAIPNLRTSYCQQTNKRMFYYVSTSNHLISDKTMKDENGYVWNDYINSL